MKSIQRYLLVVLLPLAFHGCDARTIRGAVIEQGTDKPLPGVIVYVQWMHYGGVVDSRTSCLQIDFATTDANGRYEMPHHVLGSLMNRAEPAVGVYKPGYEPVLYRNPNAIPPSKGPKGEQWVTMKPFTGTVSERLEYLQNQGSYKGACISGKQLHEKLLPFYRALYEEGKNASPTTIEERKIVRGLIYSIEEIELGDTEALKRLEDRRLRGAY